MSETTTLMGHCAAHSTRCEGSEDTHCREEVEFKKMTKKEKKCQVPLAQNKKHKSRQHLIGNTHPMAQETR